MDFTVSHILKLFLLVSIEKYQHITDDELLTIYYREENNQLLGILLQRYTLLLFGVSMKYLKNDVAAQDAVQQIFLKVILELKKYKVTYFRSWLYMVAKNHCLHLLREKYKTIPIEENGSIAAEETDFSVFFQNEKTLLALETCLSKLVDEQNTCISLFYLKKKSYQEICEQTGYSMLQVKSYIQNGKRNLKILVETYMQHNS